MELVSEVDDERERVDEDYSGFRREDLGMESKELSEVGSEREENSGNIGNF